MPSGPAIPKVGARPRKTGGARLGGLARAALVVVALSVPGGAAYAADDPKAAQRAAARDRELLRRAQSAQQEAEAARTAAEAERTKLQADLTAAQSQTKSVQGAVSKAQRRASELQQKLDAAEAERARLVTDKAALETQLAQSRKLAAELQSALDTTSATLVRREAALKDSEALGGERATRIATLEARNAKLHALVVEIVERWRGQGFWDAVKRREPFTREKSVEIENLLEDWRDRADAQRATATPAAR
jgi:chromosome segregation ATPase